MQSGQDQLMRGIRMGMELASQGPPARRGGHKFKGSFQHQGVQRQPTGGRFASSEEHHHGRFDLTNLLSTALPNEHMLQNCMDVASVQDDVTSASQACQFSNGLSGLQHAMPDAHAASASDAISVDCQVTDKAVRQTSINADGSDQICGMSNKEARLDHCIAIAHTVDAKCRSSMQGLSEQHRLRKRKLSANKGNELEDNQLRRDPVAVSYPMWNGNLLDILIQSSLMRNYCSKLDYSAC